MRFLALFNRGAIMTDDYTQREILRGDHIKHIQADIEYGRIKGRVKVFDENNRYICSLNEKRAA